MGIVLEYCVQIVYLMKMKVLTYTSYKEHCDLYIEIHCSIAVNSCQIELARKDIILLSNVSVILYRAGSCTSVKDNRSIKFSLEADTYSIDDFNKNFRTAVLQQRQNWKPPDIKDLRLVIPEHYTFMASNTIFIALGILDKHLEKTTLNKSTLPLFHTRHHLIHHLLQNHYHCTINKLIKLKTSWVDSHQNCWPGCMSLIIRKLFLQCICCF